MKSRTLTVFIIVLINLATWQVENLKACWFGEESEVMRMAMFRAEMNGMAAFRPFYYSANYLNSNVPEYSTDRAANILLWQKELGADIKLADIDSILYNTPSEKFMKSYSKKSLAKVFAGNTFITKLLLPANKSFLDYMFFSKKVEIFNEMSLNDWSNLGDEKEYSVLRNKLLKEGLATLPTLKNLNLRKRYAYQLAKMYEQNGEYQRCVDTFNKYFATNPTENIISIWAMMHKALSMDFMGKLLEANYLYSIIFMHSDEKKVRAYKFFNSKPEMISKTFAMCKTVEEKVATHALLCFRNYGPALTTLEEMQKLSSSNPYLPVFMMREINKLEDWILTPQLTENTPVLYYDTTYVDYGLNTEVFRAKNIEKDKRYLRQVAAFAEKCYDKASGEQKEYLAICAAHLFFMDDQAEKGLKYLKTISENAPAGILLQKNIDELLVSLITADISTASVQSDIQKQLVFLEKAAKEDYRVYKILYSVVRSLSQKYAIRGDKVTAGLAFLKSDLYYQQFNMNYNSYMDGASTEQSYYWYIAYFDRNANLGDMDKLLVLNAKKDKTPFETLITSGTTTSSKAYLDLKGTLAFRENDFASAYQAFKQLPEDYWAKTYEFKNFLNEDPFLPKTWPHKRDFTYDFNKTKFVKKIIDLLDEAKKNPEKSGENYLQIAHALYNTTYWGNSWMMINYSWSVVIDPNYALTPSDLLFGHSSKVNGIYYKDYYECQKAFDFYKKAKETAKNDEVAAAATYMMYVCDYNIFLAAEGNKAYDAQPGVYQPIYLVDLYGKYKSTKTFTQVQCPLMNAFAAKMK